jgi:hypothetical protein
VAAIRGRLVPAGGEAAPNARGPWPERLEAHFGVPCREVLERLYVDLGLSAREIATRLADALGKGPGDRHVYRLLRECGIPIRGRETAAKLRWARGKGDGVPGRAARRAFLNNRLGLGPEATFRRALRIAIEDLGLGAEVVVGDATWSVLPRGEVDVPVVLIDPVTQRFCRVAVEVDGWRHGAVERAARDDRKDWLLRNRGWGVLRIPEAGVADAAVVAGAAREIAAFYRVTVNPAPRDQSDSSAASRSASETCA